MVFYRLSDGFPHQLLEHCLRQLLSIAVPDSAVPDSAVLDSAVLDSAGLDSAGLDSAGPAGEAREAD